MFLHANWWHLWTNLFILWPCGPALEDLGRPFFAAFYLLAGAASGLAWTALEPRR